MSWLLDATNKVTLINNELPTVLHSVLIPTLDLLTEGGVALVTEGGDLILAEGNPS